MFLLPAAQLVFDCVRMEGPWIKEPACVTVQVASVGITVKVSAVFVMYTFVLVAMSDIRIITIGTF